MHETERQIVAPFLLIETGIFDCAGAGPLTGELWFIMTYLLLDAILAKSYRTRFLAGHVLQCRFDKLKIFLRQCMGMKSFIRAFSGAKPSTTPPAAPLKGGVQCTVCGENAGYLDSVDFNRSCTDMDGHAPRFEFAGKPIAYFLCDHCGFCFAPEFQSWSLEEFSEKIYNVEYVKVDPDYEARRPNHNAGLLQQIFGPSGHKIRHLDYGGGSGLMSECLRNVGWDSRTYDPFVDRDADLERLGDFDLVTAFEVFEHVPDVADLRTKLKKLCRPKGMILFSTQCSDKFITRERSLDWWYAAPRNGHISLFSQKSLQRIFSDVGLTLVSFDTGLHAAFHEIPEWAIPLVGKAPE